ncbi:transcription/translation regulatory transformer protein RfaH [Nitrincola tibetensis]|uniref:Transcription antitermination protein RfaH n=1 Tax=Nitrincola tibetensis TaxID=2219697 RepID=A0A364NIL4_9GAMM|nr:transcription/translation regulatory transformer protein RfaH [Nitrincola tibetensis]RAU16969.1 transcription/translation regulatory transformer protein RfaH [Nitrincola tibetensis]
MSGREWYLVQCKPGETLRAQENLENQGYECYLPIHECEKIRNRKRVILQEPLFPGYLFIYLDKSMDNWQPIRSTRGVSRMVSFGGYPLSVNHRIIFELKRRCSSIQMAKTLEKGESIRITEGAFKEIEAIFESFDGEERVVILLNVLHQQQKITLPVTSIKKA